MSDTVVDDLLEAARQATGLDDFGDRWFRGPLAAWAADLQQANLNDFGRGFLRSLMVRDLSRRLRVLHTLRMHPEVADVPIPRIVYISGLERSGTTLLHNLMALHPQARALLRWELMEPLPPPTAETHASDPRIAAVQRAIDKLRGSLIERMHWVNADEPEECVWGFIDANGLLGQAAGLCMPRWSQFLTEEDPTPSFVNYRRLLQLLLWRHPLEPGGFLVLKAPQIALHIGAFAKVFPEARFVLTDRDPFRCIVSLAAMGQSVIDPFCVVNPLADDGLQGRFTLAHVGAKLTALAAFTSARPERVEQVAYPALMAAPSATVQHVFAALGIGVDDVFAGRVASFLAAQQAGARATPPGDLPTLGYTSVAVRADPAVAAYCARFAVEPEVSRLTGGSESRASVERR